MIRSKGGGGNGGKQERGEGVVKSKGGRENGEN